MDNKDTLKAMYSSGTEADMYKKIDSFLRITLRFSRFFVWLKALLFGAAFIIMSVIFLINIDPKKVSGGAMIFLALFLIGISVPGFIIIRLITHMPRSEYDHIKALIEKEGIEKVYEDLTTAIKLKGSQIYAGSTYLFGKGVDFCRISDIEQVYLHSHRSGYSVNVRAKDEFGGAVLPYCSACGLTEKSCESTADNVREIIMGLKNQ